MGFRTNVDWICIGVTSITVVTTLSPYYSSTSATFDSIRGTGTPLPKVLLL